MDHLGRTVLYRPFYALLQILESHALIQLSCYPELRGHLTPFILRILLKEIGAGIPALATAYAALSIYYYVDHKITQLSWLLSYFISYFNA